MKQNTTMENSSPQQQNNEDLVRKLNDRIRQLEEENSRLLKELEKFKLKKPEQDKIQAIEENLTLNPNPTNVVRIQKSPNTEAKSSSTSNNFATYKKRKGTSDSGKEFEYTMCALFAIKLSINKNISDFKMTTNNENYGDFDDISVEITFKDKTTKTFLLQLKHKETKKNITNTDLASPKNDFSLLKYMKSFEEIKSDDVMCILYTNNATSILNGSEFNISLKMEKEKKGGKEQQQAEEAEITVKEIILSDHLELMTSKNTGESKNSSDAFQFEIKKAEKFKKIDKFSKQFYLFTNQNNLPSVKTKVGHMLKTILQQDISDLFIHYMKEWWSGRFVLTKHDTIAKLVELAFSPWIRTISGKKINKKSKLITKSIMNFELTIVEDFQNKVVENIWNGSSENHHRFGKAAQKYFFNSSNLSSQQKSKILWYIEEVPLVVTVNDTNKIQVSRAISLLETNRQNKRIVLVGKIKKEDFPEWRVFENLSHLQQETVVYNKIVKEFKVSLQGREKIALEELTSCGREVVESFKVGSLLEMSQKTFLRIGGREKHLVKSYISRTVSTVFLNLKKIFQNLPFLKNAVIIINCDENQKGFLPDTNVKMMELSSFLKDSIKNFQNLILLSLGEKCTINEFDSVCRTNKELNVYLLQVVDKDYCTLDLKKGNTLPLEEVKHERLQIEEREIFNHFNNQLNVFCAPPGMGKSTLLSMLSRNCPSHFWCMHIKLIEHNFFFRTKPNNEKLLQYFIEKESKESLLLHINRALLKGKRMYILLDGLDEVDSEYTDLVLDFVRYLSNEGNCVWISSRENLREKISHSLNIVCLDIQELDYNQQKVYIEKRLRKEYETEEIDRIIDSIFTSTDVVSSQQLLGIPLQLFMITENFLNDDSLYSNLNEKSMFVLTTMYRMFFEGKKKFLHQKTGIDQQEKQIGYSFKFHLKQYEIPALKSCLDVKDFEKLKITDDESSEFLEGVNEEGDKFGIITHVNQGSQAIFTHQTFAEYFTCVWLKKHLVKIRLIQKELFSEQYQNLKLIFDIMMAEETPLHLAVIYKNRTQFDKYLHQIDVKDTGGRTALHLACSYGLKYPQSPNRIERESTLYQNFVETLIEEDTDVHESDTLFDFDYIQYSLESMCLYPLEVMLQKKVTSFDKLHLIWNYYDHKTSAFYSAQLGYFNLLSHLVKTGPELVNTEIFDEVLLQTAIIGSKNEVYSRPRPGNVAAAELLIRNGADSNKSLKENFFRRQVINILDYVCQYGCYDMFKVLIDNNAKCTQGNTILHRIAQYQTIDDQTISLLESFDVDINAKNSEGITALHLVCENGQVESVKKLLERRVDVGVVDNSGNSALHFACQSEAENTEIVNLLMVCGVEVDGQNETGATPLHFACLSGQVGTVRLLLKKGASVNIVDNFDKSPLHYACQTRKETIEVINILVDGGFDTQFLTSALQIACRNGHKKIVKKLLDEKAKSTVADDQYRNLLHFACQCKTENVEIVDLLLNHGFTVNGQNRNGTTALQLACKHGHIETVKKLLEKEADVNILDNEGKSALHYAYQSLKENTEVIKFLLNCDININVGDKSGMTVLHLACLNGHVQVAKSLIEKEADASIVDNNGKNALHFACQSFKENLELVQLLLSCGIDINARNKNGATALHLACFNGQVEVVKILIEKKSAILIDDDFKSPLHYVCQSLKESLELVDLLLDNGVDVNAQNKLGATALQVACENCHGNVARKLLEKGADVESLDCDGKNSLHYACQSRRRNTEIIDLLLNYGLEVNSRSNIDTTPLHLGCQSGQVDNIKELLRAGAEVDIADRNGRNALYFMKRSSKNYEMINLLINGGAHGES